MNTQTQLLFLIVLATLMTLPCSAAPVDQATHCVAPEQPPTDYAAVQNVQIIYAQVVAYVEDNECGGEDCGPLPMLKVKVREALRGKWGGELVLELPHLAQQPRHPDKIPVGEVVLITFVEDAEPEIWSCGSLRSCDDRPPKNVLRVVDIFRHLRWG